MQFVILYNIPILYNSNTQITYYNYWLNTYKNIKIAGIVIPPPRRK